MDFPSRDTQFAAAAAPLPQFGTPEFPAPASQFPAPTPTPEFPAPLPQFPAPTPMIAPPQFTALPPPGGNGVFPTL